MTLTTSPQPTRRGTTNRNDRGSSRDRRARRAWLIATHAADVKFAGITLARCFRCGVLCYNPDDIEEYAEGRPNFKAWLRWKGALELTVDRIIPGCQGGTYVRTNIRPACGRCNSELGGSTRA